MRGVARYLFQTFPFPLTQTWTEVIEIHILGPNTQKERYRRILDILH